MDLLSYSTLFMNDYILSFTQFFGIWYGYKDALNLSFSPKHNSTQMCIPAVTNLKITVNSFSSYHFPGASSSLSEIVITDTAGDGVSWMVIVCCLPVITCCDCCKEEKKKNLYNSCTYSMAQQPLKSFECPLMRVSLSDSILITLIFY